MHRITFDTVNTSAATEDKSSDISRELRPHDYTKNWSDVDRLLELGLLYVIVKNVMEVEVVSKNDPCSLTSSEVRLCYKAHFKRFCPPN